MIDAVLLLPKILAEAGENRDLSEVTTKIAWGRAMGPGLRRHAVPFRLHGKTLIVSVADIIWQKQLHAMSRELIFRLNKVLRRQVVESIEFRIDPAALKQIEKISENRRPVKSSQPLPADLVSAASGIADSELRQLFVRAAGNCIARRESLTQAE
jgi:Dna[CI] antecedent DciA-like protein